LTSSSPCAGCLSSAKNSKRVPNVAKEMGKEKQKSKDHFMTILSFLFNLFLI
jgi:hypothetical protein